MPSPAARKFEASYDRAISVLEIASDTRLRPMSRNVSEALSHSALAAGVSAWQLYVEQIVRDFINSIYDSSNSKYLNIHSILVNLSDKAIAKLNTPNSENSRNILIEHTGFDPWSVWGWPRAGMSSYAVRVRLDEILKVRHSFAHGFPMPGYGWNTTAIGRIRLSSKMSRHSLHLLKNIVTKTDRGMMTYIKSSYNVDVNW